MAIPMRFITRRSGVSGTSREDETPEERKARWRSITIGDRAPGNKLTDPNHIRPVVQPTWEGTPVKDHRGVPYIHPNGDNITAKQFANNRGNYEAKIRELRNAPPKR